MLSREDVAALANQTPEMIVVDVPEWRGQIHIRLLSEAETESLAKDGDKARSRFAAMACCAPDGKRIFRDEDAAMLANTPGWFAALDRIWKAGAKFNGLIADGEPEKN